MKNMIKEVERELAQKGFYKDILKTMDSREKQLVIGSCICEVVNYGNHRYSDDLIEDVFKFYGVTNVNIHRIYDEVNNEDYLYITPINDGRKVYSDDISNIKMLLKKDLNNYLEFYLTKVIKKIKSCIL